MEERYNKGLYVNVDIVYTTRGEFLTTPFPVEIVLLTEMPDLLTALRKTEVVMRVLWDGPTKIIKGDVSPLQCKVRFECITAFKRLVAL